MTRGAHEAWGRQTFAHDGLGLVLLAYHHLGQFYYPFFQHNSQRLAFGILLIGNLSGEIRHMTERELALSSCRNSKFEVTFDIGDDANAIVLEANAYSIDSPRSLTTLPFTTVCATQMVCIITASNDNAIFFIQS